MLSHSLPRDQCLVDEVGSSDNLQDNIVQDSMHVTRPGQIGWTGRTTSSSRRVEEKWT